MEKEILFVQKNSNGVEQVIKHLVLLKIFYRYVFK